MKRSKIVRFIEKLADIAKAEREYADSYLMDLLCTGKIDAFENAATVCGDLDNDTMSSDDLLVANILITNMRVTAEKHAHEEERWEDSPKHKSNAAMWRGKAGAYLTVSVYLLNQSELIDEFKDGR